MLGIVRVFFIIFACSKPSASESEVGLNTKLGKFRKLGGGRGGRGDETFLEVRWQKYC